MTTETAVLALGIKGKELIMSTFKQIQAGKEMAFAMGAKNFTKGMMKTVGSAGLNAGVKAIAGTVAGALGQKVETGDSAITKNAKMAGAALKDLAHSASGLDATSFMTGITSAGAKALSGIPYLGGASEGAAELANIGIKMATGAVSAAKTAAASTVNTREIQGRNAYLGNDIFTQTTYQRNKLDKTGKPIPLKSGGYAQETGYAERYSLGEKGAIIEAIGGKFGRFAGTSLEKEVKRLFANAPDIGQATAVATGNFSALGTDKGFFMQKISDQFSNLPPSLAQGLQAQMLRSLNPAVDLMKDQAEGARATQAGFDSAERDKQQQIFKAYADNAGAIQGLNRSLGTMEANLVRAGATLASVVNSFAGSVNAIAEKIKAK